MLATEKHESFILLVRAAIALDVLAAALAFAAGAQEPALAVYLLMAAAASLVWKASYYAQCLDVDARSNYVWHLDMTARPLLLLAATLLQLAVFGAAALAASGACGASLLWATPARTQIHLLLLAVVAALWIAVSHALTAAHAACSAVNQRTLAFVQQHDGGKG